MGFPQPSLLLLKQGGRPDASCKGHSGLSPSTKNVKVELHSERHQIHRRKAKEQDLLNSRLIGQVAASVRALKSPVMRDLTLIPAACFSCYAMH